MKFKICQWTVFGFGLLLMTGLTGCEKGGAPTDTFVYCSEGSPSSFNPQLATDGTTFNSTRAIYNKLVEFKIGETVIEPALAESWEVSRDGLKYTFHLRKGVKFQKTEYFTPSRDFNADDVLFSFNRQRMKDHPYHSVGGGSYQYFTAMEMDKLIKNVRKVDDSTVEFVLARKEAPFLANMAMDFASILSAEYGDQKAKEGKKEEFDVLPVGTGPFIFQRYAKDQMVRYKANPDYFRGKPAIEKLVFTITQDASVRFQKLKAGECHLINEPAPADLKAMEADSNIVVMKKPGLNVGYLAMNVQKKPLDNPLVRKAINHALNRASYIEAIYLGNAVQAKNPIPPSMWSYNDSVEEYEYNPQRAKELLAKAGLPSGFEVEMWTLPVSRPYNPNGKKMGEMMQADLAKVGIKVKLISYDWPTYLAKSNKGEHEMIQLGWTGDNGDPDNFFNVLLGCSAVKAGSNVARWCYSPFESLIQEAKQTFDQKRREVLYGKAQEVFKEQAPWVTLAHAVVHKALRKNVKGYVIDPFGGEYFENIRLEK